ILIWQLDAGQWLRRDDGSAPHRRLARRLRCRWLAMIGSVRKIARLAATCGISAVLGAAMTLATWLAPGTGDAALLKTVTSGTVNLPNSATATQISLTGTDITKAFVICDLRSPDSTPSLALYGCDLNNG